MAEAPGMDQRIFKEHIVISVIIPVFRRKELVLQLLDSLYRQDFSPFEVIVVDDNSGDGTPAAILEAYPQTIVIQNQTNGGPSVARNRGIKQARGDIIVGLDSDVTLQDRSALGKVISIFEKSPSLGGIAFRVYLPDGKTDDHDRWWHPLPVADYAHKAFLTNYFSGTAFAFRKASLYAAGLFPEDFFQFYEEVEVAYRLLDAGQHLLYEPSLWVLHHADRTIRREKTRIYYNPRNQLLLAVACYPLLRGIGFVTPRLVYHLYRAIRTNNIPTYFKALKDVIPLIRTRLKKRRPLRPETFKLMHSLSKSAELPPDVLLH